MRFQKRWKGGCDHGKRYSHLGKDALTIKEAASYFRIGENKLRQIVEDNSDSEFVVRIGNRSLIKRKLFEQYLDQAKEL